MFLILKIIVPNEALCLVCDTVFQQNFTISLLLLEIYSIITLHANKRMFVSVNETINQNNNLINCCIPGANGANEMIPNSV